MIPIDSTLLQQIGDAFKHAGSTLALSRSPLAHGPLIIPGLVLDELSPTLDERGAALRHALQWAVEQLAPEAPAFPFGSERPPDDPTWSDPRWWRYSILRHHYLDPIPAPSPAGRALDRLLTRTGIPSVDLLIEERSRALREVAHALQRHAQQGVGSERIRALALAAVWEPLGGEPEARALLGLASAASDLLPSAWLMALAVEEGVRYPERALATLLGGRYLHTGDGAANLWMSPPLRRFVAARQLPETQRRRHLLLARLAREAGQPLVAVRQLLEADLSQQAAALLIALDEAARADAAADLLPLAQAVDVTQLATDERRALSLLLADLFVRTNQTDAALAACRTALKSTFAPRDQALLYRRLGALTQEQNPAQALAYYTLAADRLDGADPELGALLKERGWLFVVRHDFSNAEADLDRALDLLAPDDLAGRADVHDALSALRRALGDLARAVEHAHSALALRRQTGDLMRIGKSYNALGILHRVGGDYAGAIDAYRAGLLLFEQLGSVPSIASTLLNIGTAFHFAEQRAQAEEYYRRCLALVDDAGLPLTEVRARAGLVEVLVDQARTGEARLHWRAAYALSVQSGFEDEINDLRELCARDPALEEELALAGSLTPMREHLSVAHLAAALELGAPPAAGLDADEANALEDALRNGRVSASALMARAGVSKATATRKLARLERAGLLVRHGQGRSTYYTRAHAVPAVILAGDLAGLQTRLDAIAPRYAQSHGLERLEASRMAQAAAPGGESEICYDVRAIFRRLPDLRAFFDLERALTEATRTPINLTL